MKTGKKTMIFYPNLSNLFLQFQLFTNQVPSTILITTPIKRITYLGLRMAVREPHLAIPQTVT